MAVNLLKIYDTSNVSKKLTKQQFLLQYVLDCRGENIPDIRNLKKLVQSQMLQQKNLKDNGKNLQTFI